MMLGHGVSLTIPQAASAGWSPASLTGLAATVLPALSRSQGKLWQDVAKTIPAVAASDPVRVATCPFTGVDFTAPSDAARPVLGTDGAGKWWLVFNGATTALSPPDAPFLFTTGMSCFGSVNLSSFNASPYVFGARPVAGYNAHALFVQSVSGTLTFECRTSSSQNKPASVASMSTNAWSDIGVTFAAGSIKFWQAGSQVGTTQTSSGSSLATDGTVTTLGDYNLTGSSLNGSLAGFVATASPLGTTDLANLTTYLAALHP